MKKRLRAFYDFFLVMWFMAMFIGGLIVLYSGIMHTAQSMGGWVPYFKMLAWDCMIGFVLIVICMLIYEPLERFHNWIRSEDDDD